MTSEYAYGATSAATLNKSLSLKQELLGTQSSMRQFITDQTNSNLTPIDT